MTTLVTTVKEATMEKDGTVPQECREEYMYCRLKRERD